MMRGTLLTTVTILLGSTAVMAQAQMPSGQTQSGPVQGAVQGVGQAGSGIVKGTGTAVKGVTKGPGGLVTGTVKGTGQATIGVAKGTGTVAKKTGKGVWCFVTLGYGC